ncbi:hypothetical protein IFM89_037707 [Coptis chinensis]|uniref:F-box associated beta-propeller type 1 domain-containing protein n=1 Tax=Coptis chinensis TaxID=261450 RepID=A0A835IID9_9MAGN|nr:hypothetical protein IFM89_037707 [Coptis chinensis]
MSWTDPDTRLRPMLPSWLDKSCPILSLKLLLSQSNQRKCAPEQTAWVPKQVFTSLTTPRRLDFSHYTEQVCLGKNPISAIDYRSNKSSNSLLVPGRYATYLVDSNTGQQIVKFYNLPLILTGTIWGSCNGVLYIQVENEHTFFLCNPSTRECKKLPEPSRKGYPASLDPFTGFGYNTICKDYIVVRIFCPEARMEAEVYSLAKNSWRVIQLVDYTITTGKCKGIFFNNAFHWIGTPSTTEESGSDLASNFVIAFDTMSDEFRVVVQLHPDAAFNLKFSMGAFVYCVTLTMRILSSLKCG